MIFTWISNVVRPGEENLSHSDFLILLLFLFLFSLLFLGPFPFFFLFLSPLLPRFRSADILPVPIVKHPRRRYAIVALWVAWEPERADSGMRPGILTCWTFVAELPTSLCPRCVHLVIQRRDRATSLAGHNRVGGPARIHEFKRNVNSDLNGVSGEERRSEDESRRQAFLNLNSDSEFNGMRHDRAIGNEIARLRDRVRGD